MYGNELEELHRYTIWEHKRTLITEHNLHAEEFGYTLAMNRFSDLTDDEIATSLKGSKQIEQIMSANATNIFKPSPNFRPLRELDWRKRGAVTAVKNQGTCGACWAFSATGAIEGQHYLKTKNLVSLSEQNLIDCSGRYGNNGCNGGNAFRAFNYVRDNGGVDTEMSYPFEERDGSCMFSRSSVGATVRGFNWVTPQGDENALLEAVTTVGPVSVMIDANHNTFYHYNGDGVYYEPSCSSVKHDHAVLVVGYGTENGKDYWLVKNSWGSDDWGRNGYILMARNRNNNCGIASHPSYPIV